MLPFKTLSIATACLIGSSLAVVADCSAASAASLLGDTVQFDYFYPNLSTIAISQSATVVAGNSDAFNGFGAFLLDPGASGFTIDFLFSGFFPGPNTLPSFPGGISYNGFVLSSLDFDDNSSIVGFTLDTNLAGLDASRFAFTPNTFTVDFQDLVFSSNSFINVSFQTETSATPIPTPALLPGLIGMGVAALRQKRKGEAVEQAVEPVEA